MEQSRRQDQIVPADGTCDWLTDHDTFWKWLSHSQGMLWIKGKPGAGKSTLMKHSLSILERHLAEERALIASFFIYAQGEQMQRSAHGLFQSILHQLFLRFPDLPVLQDLTNTFQQRSQTIGPHGEKWSWSIGELKDTLRSVMNKASKDRPVVILVDALDELGTQAATDVIDFFSSTMEHLDTFSNLRICFSCRHYPTLTLDECLKIIVEERNDRDIHTVIRRRLHSLPNSQHLETSIVEKANGIFQWADLVTAHIRKQHLKGLPSSMLEKAVRKYPGDLFSLYSALLHESSEDRIQTIRLFQWVCFANKPLSVAQLHHAVIVDADIPSNSIDEYETIHESGNSGQEIELRFRHLSKGLIELSRNDETQSIFDATVHFIHQSVPEYLLSHGFGELDPRLKIQPAERGHLQLALTCIQYFNMLEIEQGIMSRLEIPDESVYDKEHTILTLDNYPFLRYALHNWNRHGRLAEVLKDGPDSLLKLFKWDVDAAVNNLKTKIEVSADANKYFDLVFSTIGRVFLVWRHLALDPTYANPQFTHHFGSLRDLNSPTVHTFFPRWNGNVIVQFLVYEGMWRTLDLLKQRKPLDLGTHAWVDDHGVPLVVAVNSAQTDTVKFLIGFRNVNVNCRNRSTLKTPLHYAVERGCYEIVDLLLTRPDINPDLRDVDGNTPFTLAKTPDIARCLLDTGRVDPGARDKHRTTALHSAAEHGYAALCRFLLNTNGISVDDKDTAGLTPFAKGILYQWTDSAGSSRMAKTFLSTAGVDPDAQDIEGQTPLMHATSNSNVSIVQLLLEDARVNPDSKDMYGRSPLSYAAEVGETEIVRTLLDTGKVKINVRTTRNFRGPSGLPGNFLVRIGWDAEDLREGEETDCMGYTPLHYASSKGHTAIVRLLLGTGAVEPDARSNVGRTPLSLAAEGGYDSIVRALLDTGSVDPDSRDAQGRSPFSYSLGRATYESGRTSIVNLLLDTGKVDPDSEDIIGRTPISYAASYGAPSLLQHLLSRNVELRLMSKDNSGKSPIDYARKRRTSLPTGFPGSEAYTSLLKGWPATSTSSTASTTSTTSVCSNRATLGIRRAHPSEEDVMLSFDDTFL